MHHVGHFPRIFRNATSCRPVSSCPKLRRIVVSSKLRWPFMSRHVVISQKTRIISTEVNCANSQEAAWKYVSVPTSFSMQQPCGEDWVTCSKSEPNTFADTHYKSSRLPQVIYVIITHRQMTGKVTTIVHNYVGSSRSGMHKSPATS